jgi:hypothetical protein
MDPAPRGHVEVERVVAHDDVERVVDERGQAGDDLERPDEGQHARGECDAAD